MSHTDRGLLRVQAGSTDRPTDWQLAAGPSGAGNATNSAGPSKLRPGALTADNNDDQHAVPLAARCNLLASRDSLAWPLGGGPAAGRLLRNRRRRALEFKFARLIGGCGGCGGRLSFAPSGEHAADLIWSEIRISAGLSAVGCGSGSGRQPTAR